METSPERPVEIKANLYSKTSISGGLSGEALREVLADIYEHTEQREADMWNIEADVHFTSELDEAEEEVIEETFLDFVRNNRHEYCGAVGEHVAFVREQTLEDLDDMLTNLGLPLLDEDNRFWIDYGMHELHKNALVHGLLRDPSRVVRTITRCMCDTGNRVFFEVEIEDEGPGFDPDKLPDPTNPEGLKKLNGRGLMSCHTKFDHMEIPPPGNKVRLLKQISQL